MLTVSRRAMDALAAHSLEAAPNECCGLLVGTTSRVDEAVRMTNLEESPRRYRIDPAEHIALNKELRGSGRTVVGAYHSHPTTAASPSPSDIAESMYPDFVYLIVSLVSARPEIRAWRISDGGAAEIPFQIAG